MYVDINRAGAQPLLPSPKIPQTHKPANCQQQQQHSSSHHQSTSTSPIDIFFILDLT